MEALYLIALVAVSVAIIATVADAVMSVSRKPQWAHAHYSMFSTGETTLTLVESECRRKEQMSFVGQCRRQAGKMVNAVTHRHVAVA